MAPTSNSTVLDLDQTQSTGFTLSKAELTWLVVILVLVVISAVIVCCVLFRCKARRLRRLRRSRGTSVTDGRNDFRSWNPHALAAPSVELLDSTARNVDSSKAPRAAALRAEIDAQNLTQAKTIFGRWAWPSRMTR